jgi:hypothetical protein
MDHQVHLSKLINNKIFLMLINSGKIIDQINKSSNGSKSESNF